MNIILFRAYENRIFFLMKLLSRNGYLNISNGELEDIMKKKFYSI
ncbi:MULTISPECIES: hypothetical protein [unclassified Clostridium]|nr:MULTISPECIES: hypothetical protein [unclassified Clostridium]